MKKILFLVLLPLSLFGQITPYGGKTNQTYIAGTLKLLDPKDQGFGTWSSSNSLVATVGSRTGIVTGVAQGTDIIYYIRSGVRDSLSIYVSTSDSSGYYFEYQNTNFGQLQLRDCDGITKLSLWQGGFYKSGSNSFSQIMGMITYDFKTDFYQIIFRGINTGLGINMNLSIPYSKIKDFNGSPALGGRDSVLGQMQLFGF